MRTRNNGVLMTSLSWIAARSQSKLFLVLVLLLASVAPLAGYAQVTPLVAPPGTTICPGGTNPPVLPGSTPGNPGTWANPAYANVGWNFFFTGDNSQMLVTWYTFDAAGNPIWLFTPVVSLGSNANGEKTFSAELQKATYSYATHTQSAAQTVGSVAITFVKNSTTQAAMRWQWNAAGSQSQDECLYDFFRDAPPASQDSGDSSAAINESYTGLWAANGWGMSLTVGINGNSDYTELADLNFFDNSGQPVWVSGQNGTGGSAPPSSDTNIPLYYVKSHYGMPTTTCSDYLPPPNQATPCTTITPLPAPASRFHRSFSSVTLGSASSFSVNVSADITGQAALIFPPTGDSVITFPMSMAKLTDGNEVLVSVPTCQAPIGQTTCSFQVSWIAFPETNVRLWRYDLNTNQYSSSSIGSGATDEITETLPVGSYVRYELRSAAGAVLGRSSSVRVIAAAATPGVAIPTSPQLASTPTSDQISASVGSSAGQMSIDQAGNAQYRIPLYAPHGAGGLTPELALAYNSSVGDGPLGYGWQLQGLSSVALCRRSPEHGDGPSMLPVTTNPAYSAYCLDGQRLMLVSGNNGKVGAIYRLENDIGVEVVVERGDTTDGQGSSTYLVPTIFTAYGKDGTIRRYGSTARLRQPTGTGGITLVWYQYELRDSNNNVVNYSYSTPSSSITGIPALVLNAITYAGGEIDFISTARPSAQQDAAYDSGVPVTTQAVWFSKIVVKANGATLRTYNPGYDTTKLLNSSLQAMTSLQECGGAGSTEVCYPATKFGWADIGSWTASAPPVQTRSGSDSFFHADPSAVKFGDVDGDGRSDGVFLHCDTSDCDYRDFFTAYSAPSSSAGLGLNFASACAGHLGYDSNGPCPQFSKFLNSGKSWQLLDYTGDGRSDLLLLEPISGRGDVGPYRAVVWQSTVGNVIGAAATNPFTQKITNIVRNVQTNQVGTMQFNGKVDMMSADFDGDGLPDLLTVGTDANANAGAQVWLLKQTGTPNQPYVYQGPYVFTLGSPSTPIQCGYAAYLTQSLRTSDFNGDGKADLVMRVLGAPCPGTAVMGSTIAEVNGIQLVTAETFDAVIAQRTSSRSSSDDPTSIDSSQPEYLQVFTSIGASSSSFGFQPMPSLVWRICSGCVQTSPPTYVEDASTFQVGDINGDGLADVLFAGDKVNNNTTVWLYEINRNGTMGPADCAARAASGTGCTVSFGARQTQLGDYDGDGKADFWTVENWLSQGTNKSVVHLWRGNDFAQTSIATGMYSGDIGTSPSWWGYLVDLDGDGYADSLEINPLDGHGAWQTARTTAHHHARDVVTSITSGLGAVTSIDYAPTTFRSVYTHDYSGPIISAYSGRGSPVQDVQAPRYVVQYQDSSAPLEGQPNALSTIRYKYGGLQIQGGGRGSLGYSQVTTIDAQTGIQTITSYNRNYPLTGTPLKTTVYNNAETVDTLCASPGSPDDPACMFRLPLGNTVAGQQELSEILDTWTWRVYGASAGNTALAGPLPIFVSRQRSTARKWEFDGSTLSSTRTNFTYNPTYGEVLTTDSLDYSNANQSPANVMREITTTNQYLDVDAPPSAGNNYIATWHIGRLSSTSVTAAASGIEGVYGATYPTRSSSFIYDAVSGQLTEEHLQTGAGLDQALTTYHVHNSTGDEIKTVTCADSVGAACSGSLTAAAMTFQSSDANWVQRYTRTTYDAAGIYPTGSYAPFSNGGVSATE